MFGKSVNPERLHITFLFLILYCMNIIINETFVINLFVLIVLAFPLTIMKQVLRKIGKVNGMTNMISEQHLILSFVKHKSICSWYFTIMTL